MKTIYFSGAYFFHALSSSFSVSFVSFQFSSNWTYGCLLGFSRKLKKTNEQCVRGNERVRARVVFLSVISTSSSFAFWRWQLHVPQFRSFFHSSLNVFPLFLLSRSLSCPVFKSSKSTVSFSSFLLQLSFHSRWRFIALHQIRSAALTRKSSQAYTFLMCFAVRKEKYLHHRLNVPLNQCDFFLRFVRPFDNTHTLAGRLTG